MSADRPRAEPDALSGPFFAALAEGRLAVQRCADCGTRQLNQERCLTCCGEDLAWSPASGAGHVHSFVVMHTVFHPAFAGEVPYVVALVELEEGPRVFANIEGLAPGDMRTGLRVLADLSAGASRLIFRPAD